MVLTLSMGSFSCVIMKSLTVFFGSSVGCSGMPVKTRLSLMLRACKSRMFSFIVLLSAVTAVSCVVSVLTDCCNDLFSCVSFSIWTWLNSRLWRRVWNSLCKTYMSAILLTSPESLCSMEIRMSLSSVQQGGFGGESELERGDGRDLFLSFTGVEVDLLFSLFIVQSLSKHSSM